MNKKLIALAVAAAFAAPVAMADVTVYGKVHLDITSTDAPNSDKIEVTNNSSRLGFKGSEDLGNGLKAIFKYEMTYSGVDDGTAIGSARNSYLGLAGDFGTFLVGRHDTPAKSAYYAAGNDHLDSTVADINDMGFIERRVHNAVAYMSPNMSGFKAAVAVTAGEQSGENPLNDENSLMDSYSVGLMYKNSGLKAGFGYEKIANTAENSGDSPDITTMHVGASYTFSNITLGAQYTNNDNYFNDGDDDTTDHVQDAEQTSWAISGKYAFGNNAVAANFGNKEVENAANATSETDYMGIGFIHNMSKRTSVWVAYGSEDPENTDSTSKFGVGMSHSF